MHDSQEIMKVIHFESDGRVPMNFHINESCWQHYPQEVLFDLMEGHPYLFPDFVRPSGVYTPSFGLCSRAEAPYVDDFGCMWETTMDGIVGTVTKHPLADWDAFETYRMPDPAVCMGIGPIDWAAEAERLQKARARGESVVAALRHGHTFLQLADLRGYENFVYDMADEEPRLYQLIEMLEAFNIEIVRRYVDIGIDMMCYPDDMGMQFTPMISPEHFRKYLKPSCQRLMQAARQAGVAIHMHSDGCIRDLADDLVDSGVEVLNLQDLVNGIDWIAAKYAGQVCIELDIDRQNITPMGSPAQIDALIREEVTKLGSKKGGLMMIYGLYPGVPLENVKALMDAMEKYAFYWAG